MAEAPQKKLDLEFLSRVSNLTLRAGMLVDGTLTGMHPSPKPGSSPEFREYRSFRPGDSPRDIDWRASARRDETLLRLRDDETRLSCRILLDCSRSLDYGGKKAVFAKFDYARLLSAALILILQRQCDAAGLTLLGDTVLGDHGVSLRRTNQMRMLEALEQMTPKATDCALLPELARLASAAQRRSMLIVISDFYTDPDQLHRRLEALGERKIRTLLLQILDPSEIELEWDDPVLAVDLENGRELLIHPDERRASYRKLFADHLDALKHAAQSAGAEYLLCRTDEIPGRALGAATAMLREARR